MFSKLKNHNKSKVAGLGQILRARNPNNLTKCTKISVRVEEEIPLLEELIHFTTYRVDLEMVKNISRLIEARTVRFLDITADIRTANEVILSVYQHLELWCMTLNLFCRKSLSFNKKFKGYVNDLVVECQKQPVSKAVIKLKMENVRHWIRKATQLADKIVKNCQKLANCRIRFQNMDLPEMSEELSTVVFEPLEEAFGKLENVRDDLEKFGCALSALEDSAKGVGCTASL